MNEIILIPVNCNGVMGSGLALLFKQRHHDCFLEYRELCKTNLKAGHPVMSKIGNFIYFPTKNDWRNKSEIIWIEKGLEVVNQICLKNKIERVLTPKLGCGCGGLEWLDVQPLLKIISCEVKLYGK